MEYFITVIVIFVSLAACLDCLLGYLRYKEDAKKNNSNEPDDYEKLKDHIRTETMRADAIKKFRRWND